MAADKLSEFFSRDRKRAPGGQSPWLQLALSALIIGFILLLMAVGRFQRVESLILDYFIRQRPPLTVHSDIVLITIDEESLESIGPLPWPDKYYAEIISWLGQWGAKSIVFDHVPGKASPETEEPSLEEVLRRYPKVYFPVKLQERKEKKIWVHSLPIVLKPKGQGEEWVLPKESVREKAKGLGNLTVSADSDGVLRRVPAFLAANDEVFPYLGLKVADDTLGKPVLDLYDNHGVLDDKKQLMINWSGPWERQFPQYSFAEVIRSAQALATGKKPVLTPDQFRGKICLIGVTAPSRAVGWVTALAKKTPNLAVLATVLNSALTGQMIHPMPLWGNALCLIVLGLLSSFLFLHFRKVSSFVTGLLLGVVWAGLSFLVFVTTGVWLSVFYPLLLVMALFVFAAIYNQLAASREQRHLFDLATRDGLTGLYVIRHFREILNRVAKETLKNDETLSLILIDIDNFKPINDTYGHLAGDAVLKRVAEIILSCLRTKRKISESDFIGRYGGEEFIILLRNADLKTTAADVAERVRRSVEQATFRWKDIFIPVTISVGVATRHENEKAPDPMVHRADEALYEAKRNGKNQVRLES